MKLDTIGCKQLLVFAAFIAFNSAFAQKQGIEKIDSLKEELFNYKSQCTLPCIEDTVKAKILSDLGIEWTKIQPDSSLLWAEKLKEVSNTIKWEVGIGDYYLIKGVAYQWKAEYSESESNLNKSLEIWRTISSSKISEYKRQSRIGSTLSSLGSIHYNQALNEEAKNYFNQALEIFKKLKDDNLIATQYYGLSNIYLQQGKYPAALEELLKALSAFEKAGNKDKLADCYANIGLINRKQNRFGEAIFNYTKALTIKTELNDLNGISQINDLMGSCYYYQKNYLLARKHHLIAYEYAEKAGNKNGIARTLNNIGTTYEEEGNNKEALNYYIRSLQYQREVGDLITLAITLGNIGNNYFKINDFENGESYLKQSFFLSDSIGDIEGVAETGEILSNLYSQLKQYDKALDFFKRATIANDSLFNEEETKKITELEMNYAFNKKEDSTKTATNLQIVVASQKQKQQRNFGLVIILVFTGVALLLFRDLQIKRKKEKAELLLKASENEMKSLRSQMNPHFIKNALGSIQISMKENRMQSREYLEKFQKLMSLVLLNSESEAVPLKNDMEALTLYMEIENLSQNYPFTYDVRIDEQIDTSYTKVPPLILQPVVENAIKHGLGLRNSAGGHIDIDINEKDDNLVCIVKDNGVGRNYLKDLHQSNPIFISTSMGIKLTQERIKIINEVKNAKASLKIIDLDLINNGETGTKVELTLPLSL